MSDEYIITSRARIALFYAYLVAIGILAIVVTKVVLDNRNIAQESHRGLCTLKDERERRVQQTAAILSHPNEDDNALVIRSLGRPLLVRSLVTAKSDRDALKDVSC